MFLNLMMPSLVLHLLLLLFFFQAEDGIRDLYVTGVQTCALPILARAISALERVAPCGRRYVVSPTAPPAPTPRSRVPSANRPPLVPWRAPVRRTRSEERRVGKEWRSTGSRYHYNKNELEVDRDYG